MGVYELLEMNPLIRELTFAKASSLKIRAEARANGMSSLMDDGVRKVLDGKTTIEEVPRTENKEDT